MAATVYSGSRYGITDDSSATGLMLASFSSTSEVEQAFAKNHIGCDAGMALYNDGATVEVGGVVAVKATGLALNLASVLSLANVTDDSLNTNTANLFSTPSGNAGLVVTNVGLTRGNTAFEEGTISGVYKPLIATNAPSTVT